jgi:hypothetical protein
MIRLVVPVEVVIVVFLAGVAVGVCTMSFQVTPGIVVILAGGSTTTEASPCGGAQWSFDGFFPCSVTLASPERGPGSFMPLRVSAPGSTNSVVNPAPPIILPCEGSASFVVAS